jgi:hypothetical protein
MPDADPIVVKSLKARFFDLALKEDFPRTPAITTELDNLKAAIRKYSGHDPVVGPVPSPGTAVSPDVGIGPTDEIIANPA